jgi:MFS family permease
VSVGIEIVLFYPAGWIMDHHGRFWVAVSCVAVMAVGFALLPLASTAMPLLAVAAVMGVGNGLGSGIVMTIGADVAPERGRSQFLGAWRTCGELGQVAGPAVLAGLAAALPLAGAAVLAGAVSMAGAGWVGYWVRRSMPVASRKRIV